MADYKCYPLWETTSPANCGDVDPSTLPISQDLVRKLDEWSEIYDSKLNQDYPPDSGFETPEAADAFMQQGRLLAARLREELGPDYTITEVLRAKVRTAEP